MRHIVVLFIIAFPFAQAVCSSDDYNAWISYKAKYNKVYPNEAEDKMRFELFKKSKKLVEENNAAYKKGEVTYTLGLTPLSDLTEEEFKNMRGVVVDDAESPKPY